MIKTAESGDEIDEWHCMGPPIFCEFSWKMMMVGSTDKNGGFCAMLHYVLRFD